MMYPTKQLTLFAADTRDLANLSVWPGSDKAKQMTVNSGRRCLELYKKSGPLGYLVKTLLGTSAWGSTKCYLTWKVSATKDKRLLFRLVPLVPHIEETEFSLWPIPTANDGKNITLPRFFPTPTASRDYKPIRPLAPSEANGAHGTMLVGAIGRENPEFIGMYLNPQFSEWLMGFPITWTEL